MCKRQNKKAFTLIELIVTSVITSIMGLALLSIFFIGLRTYTRIKQEDQSRSKLILALERIEEDLVNIFYFDGVGFTGYENSLSFVLLSADEQINIVSYFIDSSGKSYFCRKVEPYVQKKGILTTSGDGSKNLTLISNARFEYYGINKISGKYEWKSFWGKEEGIPKLVRITLGLNQDDRDISLSRTIFIPLEKNI